MGIEDRDYMRGSSSGVAPKILGMARWQFALCLIVIIGFVVWKSGAVDKLFKDKDKKEQKQSKGSTFTGTVNVNTATKEELKALPDVDGKIADDIIKRRPYKALEDLMEVKGIGQKKLDKLRPHLTL
jgi:competence ComEA-like helix-hairpin-helix protein